MAKCRIITKLGNKCQITPIYGDVCNIHRTYPIYGSDYMKLEKNQMKAKKQTRKHDQEERKFERKWQKELEIQNNPNHPLYREI